MLLGILTCHGSAYKSHKNHVSGSKKLSWTYKLSLMIWELKTKQLWYLWVIDKLHKSMRRPPTAARLWCRTKAFQTPETPQPWSPDALPRAIVTLITAKPAEHETQLGWEKCACSPDTPWEHEGQRGQQPGVGERQLCAHRLCVPLSIFYSVSKPSKYLAVSCFPLPFSASRLMGEAIWCTGFTWWGVASVSKRFMSD